MPHASFGKSAVLTSVLTLVSVVNAHSATGNITVTRDASMPVYGAWAQLAEGSASRLTLSPLFVSAMTSRNATFEGVEPGALTATFSSRKKYRTVVVDMPVTSISGALRPEGASPVGLDLTDIRQSGGVAITMPNDGLGSFGGAMSIYNLRVSMNDDLIYADISGANGVGILEQMPLWQIKQVDRWGASSDLTCDEGLMCKTTLAPVSALSELRLTKQGFDVASQSLGWTEDTRSAMGLVDTYGTLVTYVPESSSWMLMGLGLAAMGTLARRRPTTH